METKIVFMHGLKDYCTEDELVFSAGGRQLAPQNWG